MMFLPDTDRRQSACKRWAMALAVSLAGALLGGCHMDMVDQPKFKPLAASTFFDDGLSARPLVQGTVARGQLRTDQHLYQGRVGGELAAEFPAPVTRQTLERGRERYDIFCSPCHDRTGSGHGIVVLRGFKQPPSFHIQRLQEAPVGYYYDVITNGFATMYSYAERISPEDRWAIIAYVRALQLSQYAAVAELPEQDRQALSGLSGQADNPPNWPAPKGAPQQ